MYVPEAFAEEDVPTLHAAMREHPFALLVTAHEAEPFATHVPLLLDPKRGPLGTLYGHVARSNPHWRSFGGARAALAVFSGPHAYVSPRWFASKRQVPTWNYVAVHATGVPRVIDDAAHVHMLLRQLSAAHEPPGDGRWLVDELPMPVLDGLARGIVAFELPIARLQGKWKLSQNKSEADRAGVAAALRAGGDPTARAVAEWMERVPVPTDHADR